MLFDLSVFPYLRVASGGVVTTPAREPFAQGSIPVYFLFSEPPRGGTGFSN